MRNHIIIATVAALLVACSSTSKVLEVGPNTYSVSAWAQPARGGTSAANTEALKQANAHCRSAGKDIEVVESSRGTADGFIGYGLPAADVIFRCVDQAP